MSRETIQALNANTLVGYTDKRGAAWHYRAEDQGVEPNHYPGPIPVQDVYRRLFDWVPVEAEITATALTNTGVISVNDPERKAIVRPDTGTILGIFKQGYRVHRYDEWLVKNVETLLDADLAIGSAGLLRGGAQAWVQIEMADTLSVDGVAFRPHLMAATSMDGSLSSTYVAGNQVVVCDNTMYAALGERTAAKVKIKHSVNSLTRVGDVREALGIIHGQADAFAEQVKHLTDTTVSDDQWDKFLAAYAGASSDTARSKTLAETKQRELYRLWNYDERVTPWKNTAWGVMAAVNTYAHHFQTVRGATRSERNMSNAVLGVTAKADMAAMDLLVSVL